MNGVLVSLAFGVASYFGAQTTKSEGWSKYVTWLYQLLFAVGIGLATSQGADANEQFQRVFGVVGGSAISWGAGKVTGVGGLFKAELLGSLLSALAKGIGYVGGNGAPGIPTPPSPSPAPVSSAPSLEASLSTLHDIVARYLAGRATREETLGQVEAWRKRNPALSIFAPPGYPAAPS